MPNTSAGAASGVPPKDESEHFMRCPKCNGWVDMRDLGPGVRGATARCRIRLKISRSEMPKVRN